MNALILAAISGQAVVTAIIYLIVFGIIFWILWWALNRINPPEPFKKVGEVVLILASVLVLINFLLSLAGKPIISWP